MTNTYTIADLQALPDNDLNALAAKLRGLQYLPRFGNVFNFVWFDGEKIYAQDVAFADNRDQSGELLQWAAKQGCYFTIGFGDFNSDVRVRINLERTQYGEREIFLDATIPANDARAETSAFCAAMLAMAGRLM